jgi:hypothetical protein
MGNVYQLAPGSQAFGSGIATFHGQMAPMSDYTGMIRQTTPFDIGAYAH